MRAPDPVFIEPFSSVCGDLPSYMKQSIESVNPVVRSVIEGTAPRQAQVAAARGLLPLPENDLLEVLVNFAASDDAEVAVHARQTLELHDVELVRNAVSSPDIAVSVISYFAGNNDINTEIHEKIIQNPKTPPATILDLVRNTRTPELIELVSLNQQLLIQTPAIIDAIIANPNKTSEADRRAAETKREFFEKERGVQQIANELRAQGKDAAAEFIEAADLSGAGISDEDALALAAMIEVPDSETDDSWMGLEYIEELYEETPEERQALVDKIIGEFKMDNVDLPSERISIINRIMKMGMKDRVRLAMQGDREARNILVRDPNRVVCQAVVNNPRITEHEIEKVAAMRSISVDVLRQIANSRQWSRSYVIVHNLARNPRAPIANVLTILSRLQLRDLSALSKNKNVSDAVRRQALRLVQARSGK
jgi:hypothetical protein